MYLHFFIPFVCLVCDTTRINTELTWPLSRYYFYTAGQHHLQEIFAPPSLLSHLLSSWGYPQFCMRTSFVFWHLPLEVRYSKEQSHVGRVPKNKDWECRRHFLKGPDISGSENFTLNWSATVQTCCYCRIGHTIPRFYSLCHRMFWTLPKVPGTLDHYYHLLF